MKIRPVNRMLDLFSADFFLQNEVILAQLPEFIRVIFNVKLLSSFCFSVHSPAAVSPVRSEEFGEREVDFYFREICLASYTERTSVVNSVVCDHADDFEAPFREIVWVSFAKYWRSNVAV